MLYQDGPADGGRHDRECGERIAHDNGEERHAERIDDHGEYSRLLRHDVLRDDSDVRPDTIPATVTTMSGLRRNVNPRRR